MTILHIYECDFCKRRFECEERVDVLQFCVDDSCPGVPSRVPLVLHFRPEGVE